MAAADLDSSLFARAQGAVEALDRLVPSDLRRPRIGIVCGSGLSGIAAAVEEPRVVVEFSQIPGFSQTTCVGHQSTMVFGKLGDNHVPVVLLQGRVHFYESRDMGAVTWATRVLRVLGVEILICGAPLTAPFQLDRESVTNACGGLNPDYNVGDVIILNDHLNFSGLAGCNPLVGPNEAGFGTRFPPLSDAYDFDLRRRAHRAWKALDLPGDRTLREGVYGFAAGPCYETRCEARMLRTLGADVVGMSTIPEVIVARHSGMRVLVLGTVCNAVVLDPVVRADDPRYAHMTAAELAAHLSRGAASHVDVVAAGNRAAKDVQALVARIVDDLGADAGGGAAS